MNTRKINIILIITIVALIIFILFVKLKSDDYYITKDPDTDLITINDSSLEEKTINPDNRFTLNTDRKIFKLGLKPNEYERVVDVVSDFSNNEYRGRYNQGKILPSTVFYIKEEETFMFNIEVADDLTFNITLRRKEYNIIQVKLTDSNGKSVDKSVKINKLL